MIDFDQDHDLTCEKLQNTKAPNLERLAKSLGIQIPFHLRDEYARHICLANEVANFIQNQRQNSEKEK